MDDKDIANLEFKNRKLLDDYKFLLQKLKSIKDKINLLEKTFSPKRNNPL